MSSRELDAGLGRSSLEDRLSLFGRLMDTHRTVRKGQGGRASPGAGKQRGPVRGMQSSSREQEKSLFHRRLTRRRRAPPDDDPKFLLHRLLVVGRLSCGLADRTAVGGHYERLNISVQRSRPGEEVTGVLLLYPEHTLLVIECSTEALLFVLQDLKLMEENLHSGLIQEPRILLVSHDLQQRLFQQWSSGLWSEPEGRRAIVSEDQSSEQLVSQTLGQVLRLGRHLLSAAGQMTGSRVIPDEVLKDAVDVIPPQAAVCRLVQMEALLSPARYMSTYHSPLHQLLDSESVWPAVEHLQIL